MSGLISVVEDYESEDEGLDILFGDTTEIPPDRRKQMTQQDATIPELRRMIEEKEKDRRDYEEALKNNKFVGSNSLPYLKMAEEKDSSSDSEDEDDSDAKQLVYQGQSYIRFPKDQLVTSEQGDMIGEWDPVKNKIFNWQKGMFQKHLKARGPWRKKDEKY